MEKAFNIMWLFIFLVCIRNNLLKQFLPAA